jgi:nitroreductase
MKVQEAIEKRRAYRSMEKIKISAETKQSLAKAAQLAPSCFNNQPWRYVFVDDETLLQELHSVYSKGNEWTHDASMMIAVCSHKELDCMIKDRLYYAFDTGLASGQMLLQAVELGLVAHPIAGFSPSKVKKILSLPQEWEVLTLILIGGYKYDKDEAVRPLRKTVSEIVFTNKYGEQKND